MNRFKVGALGALMVLGGSVYGMDKDTELTESLMQHAQPVSPGSTVYGSVAATPEGTPERDVESGEVVAKPGCLSALKSRVGSWFKPCADVTKRCWGGMPQVGKDAIEIGFWLAVDIATTFQSNETAAFVLAQASGFMCAGATERHAFYLKAIGAGLAVGLWKGLQVYCGLDFWTLWVWSLSYAIQSGSIDYEKLSGRRNIIPEILKKLPVERKKEFITGLVAWSKRFLAESCAENPIQPATTGIV